MENKWINGEIDLAEPTTLEMVEVSMDTYIQDPLPLGMEAQKRLLELIYSRKSGIITRQELIDVLFNPESLPRGTYLRRRIG